jgi:hypothetical protein
MLRKVGRDVLIKDSYELLSMHLVRDSHIEELAREVFSEFETEVLNDKLVQAIITVLSAYVLPGLLRATGRRHLFRGRTRPAPESVCVNT